VAELQGLGAALRDHAGIEAALLAISADPPERGRRLAGRLGAAARVLSDPALGVARRYGVLHPRGGPLRQDVARPATLVIDRDGIVRWISLSANYQVRPDPTAVVEALRSTIRR